MQQDFWESKIDRAIRRLQDNEPECEPYYGATSGGKDSIVIMKLSEMAGVDVNWWCNLTTVDPPELIRFIRHNYPEVRFNRPEITMWKLIAKKRMPPTRKVRYCCKYFKESGGRDAAVVMTGVRRAESHRRSNRQPVECFSRRLDKRGIVSKQIVNPIIDWTNNDVWSFIREQGLKYCSLYDEGFSRLGCVGCPMGGKKGMEKYFLRWPYFKRLYIKAFQRMIEKRIEDGLTTDWASGDKVFRWWINNEKKKSDDDTQLSLFE